MSEQSDNQRVNSTACGGWKFKNGLKHMLLLLDADYQFVTKMRRAATDDGGRHVHLFVRDSGNVEVKNRGDRTECLSGSSMNPENQQGTLIPGRYGLQARSILPKRKSAITLIRASLTISALMEIITNVHLVLIFINCVLTMCKNNWLLAITTSPR